MVRVGDDGPVLADAHWGFTRSGGATVINARSERAAHAPLFRDAFRNGRCLVPADGFFEWRKEGRTNQPYLFRRPDGSLLLMAGLWQNGCYVVLTCDAQGQVADIHDRMPVVLGAAAAHQWLDAGKLAPSGDLRRIPVSPRVNRTENDDPACLEPIAQSSFDFD